VERSVVIQRPREELFRFWRNLENLPTFMSHLRSVTQLGGDRSRWVVSAPAGSTVQWDAEVYNEQEPDFIAWRSLQGSDINHAGSVHFSPAPGGTEVRVELNYEPPAGKLGSAIARFFGKEPEQQVDYDLHRLKRIMESGDPPAQGWPAQPSIALTPAGEQILPEP
jgi:uncharacterized membrane protein